MQVRTQMFRYNSYGDDIYYLRDNGETKIINIRNIERDKNGNITKVTELKRDNGKDIVKESKQFEYKEIDGKFYVTYRSINNTEMNKIIEEETEFIEDAEGKYNPNFFTLRKYLNGELVSKDSRYPDGKFEHIVYNNSSSSVQLIHDSLLYISIVYDHTVVALEEEEVPVPYTETKVTIPDSAGNNNTYENKYELVSVDGDIETYKLTQYKNGEKIEPEEEYYDTYNRKTKEFIKYKGSDKETKTKTTEYTDYVYGNCKHIECESGGKVFGEFIWSDKYGYVKRSVNGSSTETQYFDNKVKKINSTNFKSDIDRTDNLFLTENTETRDKLGRVVMVEYLSLDKSNGEERYKACSHSLYFYEGNSLNASKIVSESEIEYYEYDEKGNVKFITTVSGIDKEMFDFYYNKIINQLANEEEEDE